MPSRSQCLLSRHTGGDFFGAFCVFGCGRGGFFLLVPQIHRQEEEGSARANGRNIEERADIPARCLGDLLEHDQRGIFRPDEEHIDASVRGAPKEQVDAEGNHAQHEEGKDSADKMLLFGRAAPRGNQVEANEHQRHMPNEGVQGQRPVSVHDARRLKKGDKAAKQVKGGHKRIHRAGKALALYPRCDHAQVHRDRAELEGEDPPLVLAPTDIVCIKKLFIDLGDDQKQADRRE